MVAERVEKLTIEAQVCLACRAMAETAVSRGMSIQSSEGQIVGELAAVLVNGRSQQPTHLVLCCQLPDYRLVPLENVVGVYGRTVQLSLTREQVNHLPQHQPKL